MEVGERGRQTEKGNDLKTRQSHNDREIYFAAMMDETGVVVAVTMVRIGQMRACLRSVTDKRTSVRRFGCVGDGTFYTTVDFYCCVLALSVFTV